MARRSGDHARHRQALYHLYQSMCWLCGKPNAAEIDHVIPVSQGGSDAMENLRLAHKECNVARNQRSHKWHMAPKITEHGFPHSWHDLTLTPGMWDDRFAAKAAIMAAEKAEAARKERAYREERDRQDQERREARLRELAVHTREVDEEAERLKAANEALAASAAFDHRALKFSDRLGAKSESLWMTIVWIGTPIMAIALTWFVLAGPIDFVDVENNDMLATVVITLIGTGFVSFWVVAIIGMPISKAPAYVVRLPFRATNRGRAYQDAKRTLKANTDRLKDLEYERRKIARQFESAQRSPSRSNSYYAPKRSTYRPRRSYRRYRRRY